MNQAMLAKDKGRKARAGATSPFEKGKVPPLLEDVFNQNILDMLRNIAGANKCGLPKCARWFQALVLVELMEKGGETLHNHVAALLSPSEEKDVRLTTALAFSLASDKQVDVGAAKKTLRALLANDGTQEAAQIRALLSKMLDG